MVTFRQPAVIHLPRFDPRMVAFRCSYPFRQSFADGPSVPSRFSRLRVIRVLFFR